MLAVLDNNNNSGRDQKKTVTKKDSMRMSVKSHYRIAYRKPSKKFIARKFYTEKSYGYLRRMLESVQERASSGMKCDRPTKTKNMAPKERRSRLELIADSTKYKRFKNGPV